MLPTRIVNQARDRNLAVIGICDHNSAENVSAVRAAGLEAGVRVIGGMEICSAEEVHVLAMFDDDDSLARMQAIVYDHLPGQNDEEVFGEQVVVDASDNIIGCSRKLLIGATTLGIDRIVELIHGLGGLAVASHVDREAFGIIGQLGFIPDQLPLDALEVSWRCAPREALSYSSGRMGVMKSSDAHLLSDIGRGVTTFALGEVSLAEVRMAMLGLEGRSMRL